MISDYHSKKIIILNFVAILLVLYIHAVYNEASCYPIANYIQEVMGFGGLSLLANPLFYSISGFLFFSGINKNNNCYPKIKKRVRTLFVPYILWNIIFVVWFVLLQNLPGVSSMINSDVIGSITGKGFINGLFIMFIKPVAFQLWFLRDLIIYVILSPLFFLALKQYRFWLPLVLFVASWVGLIFLPPEIKIWGAFFFVFGGYIAVWHKLDDLTRNIGKLVFLLSLSLYLLNALASPLIGVLVPGSAVFFMLCGVIAIWCGYDLLIKNDDSILINKLVYGGGYSFFIYCFHEPFLNIIKKLGLKILGVSDVSLTILYIVNPLIMCAIAIIFAIIMKSFFPKVYSILVGGR